MHPLTTFYKVSYNITDTGLCVTNPVTGVEKYPVRHFYNDTEFFSEFFKVVVTPESDVLDIGVNFGLHTDIFLNLTKGNIYAFDASPGIFPIIESKYKNQINVKLFNVAVTNFDGVVEFLDTEDLGAGSIKSTKANINTKIKKQTFSLTLVSSTSQSLSRGLKR
jgi:FkbM family methyltransferase